MPDSPAETASDEKGTLGTLSTLSIGIGGMVGGGEHSTGKITREPPG